MIYILMVFVATVVKIAVGGLAFGLGLGVGLGCTLMFGEELYDSLKDRFRVRTISITRERDAAGV